MTEDPLRFRCTACGECCRRLRAAVTDRDLERLVHFTQKSAEALVEWLSEQTANDLVDQATSELQARGLAR